MMILSYDFNRHTNRATEFIPLKLRRYFFGMDMGDVREIRMRCGKHLSMVTDRGIEFITKDCKRSMMTDNAVIINQSDIDDAMELLTASSLYSSQNEIKNGFITVFGGNRIGICGTMAPDNKMVTDISGLNYRFAREIIGSADKIFERIYNGGNIKNTLIISPPGCGKTTLLRDLIRQVSDFGRKVSVVDERGEISAGSTYFDLGENTDVFYMCEKTKGIMMMIRSMSPDVIAVDEIGSTDDAEAIKTAARSGVATFATMHAGLLDDIPKNILDSFNLVITLSCSGGVGTIEDVIDV